MNDDSQAHSFEMNAPVDVNFDNSETAKKMLNYLNDQRYAQYDMFFRQYGGVARSAYNIDLDTNCLICS